MPVETIPFDGSKYLDKPESQIELLSDAFDSGDAAYIAHALGVVARARGMTSIAKEAGVTREALYRALSEKGDPRLSTIVGVIKALGLKLSAGPNIEATATGHEPQPPSSAHATEAAE